MSPVTLKCGSLSGFVADRTSTSAIGTSGLTAEHDTTVRSHDRVRSRLPPKCCYDVADHVATITLNAPERMNTISGPMLGELSARLLEADRDRDVRCIVLTGDGRAFCAGLDLAAADGRARRAASATSAASTPAPASSTCATPRRSCCTTSTRPPSARSTAARPATGSTSPSAATSASPRESAKLNPGFAKRGILPESGGTWLLPRMVGYAKAAEIAFTGRTLRAKEALELGLVNHVVPDAELAATHHASWPPRSPPTRRSRCGRSSG